jgi:hypothetical protein
LNRDDLVGATRLHEGKTEQFDILSLILNQENDSFRENCYVVGQIFFLAIRDFPATSIYSPRGCPSAL